MVTDATRFESVAARDVALLVREELSLSTPFRSWLLEASGLDTEADSPTLLRVGDVLDDSGRASQQSGSDSDSGARLEVRLGLEDREAEVLLGLVIALDAAGDGDTDSDATPTEFVDPKAETRHDGRLETDQHRWDRTDHRTVLLAPRAALESTAPEAEADSSVDATVALESLRDRLGARDTDRGDYRAGLVTAAIERGGRSGAAGPSVPPVVREYRSRVSDRDPGFDLRIRSDHDASHLEDGRDDPTVAIEAPALADDHRLRHDLASGTVDLLIPGAAEHVHSFAARYAGVVPPATELLTDDDAIVCRLSVPSLETESSLEDEAVVGETIAAVDDLLSVSDRVDERGA